MDEPELFVEFLRNFVSVDILKDIDPTDVEDMTERLLPLISEQKELDTFSLLFFMTARTNGPQKQIFLTAQK